VTEIGPLASQVLLSGFLAAVDRARREGATLLTGGRRVDSEGYVVEPALFEHVSDESFLSREEIFGPVASLYKVVSLDEAISRCNGSDFGLSASIFTSDISGARHFVKGVDAGIVRINAATAGGECHVPFGGTKKSGYGAREQGRAAREFYTQEVTVYEND
jgi:acyl-CoA reductase-like NAD-dependent aldehyde dehydrogenase